MKRFTFMFFYVLILTAISCSDSDGLESDPIQTDEVLYLNSFEVESDFNGITGNGYYRSDDVAINSGDSSIVVSGGCVGPHFYLELGPYPEDKKLTVNFHAKTYAPSCGSVQLSNMNTFENIYVTIQDSVWTEYQSLDTLEVLASDSLRLNINSGGIGSCDTWIDLLTITHHE